MDNLYTHWNFWGAVVAINYFFRKVETFFVMG
jgi:hypothetical protein